MANEVSSGQIPSSSLLQGSQATVSNEVTQGGKVPPTGGKLASPAASSPPGAAATASAAAPPSSSVTGSTPATPATPPQPPPPPRNSDPKSLVAILNKSLNDSGRPDQFRVDPVSGALIQQINPSNGDVVGQFPVSEFPALARSIGASTLGSPGLIFDGRA